MPARISPPTTDEYAPFYADYIQRAAKRANVLTALADQLQELHAALDRLSDAQAHFKPGPGEWSIKEVMGHINDVERVFSYRLLRISRGDATPLPGFEQEDYVRAAGFDRYPLGDLLKEFELLRFLADRPGLAMSRQQILDTVWGHDWYGDERTVDVHIAQVRFKLGEASPIRTVRGVGYAVSKPAPGGPGPAEGSR